MSTDGDHAILVVDDDPLMAGLVESCLEVEGARVIRATTLNEALAHLDPALRYIVLDCNLGGADDLALLPHAAGLCPEVPVVVLSDADERSLPDGVQRVDRGDLATLTEVLGLEPERSRFPEDRLLHRTALPDDLRPPTETG